MYKIYVSYDMQAGKEEECQRYFSQVLGPTLVRFGANVADVWYTVWGESPQIQSGSLMDTEEEVQRLLASKKWRETLDGLAPLVNKLTVRAVRI